MHRRSSTPSFRWAGRIGVCGALACTVLAAAAVPSAGAAVSGETTVKVASKGKATESLRKQRVRLRAVRPAKLRRGRLRVPVVRMSATRGRTTVTHRGGIVLRRGRRRVGLRAMQVRVSRKRRTVVARVGGRRMTVLTIRRSRLTSRSSESVRLRRGTAVVTRRAARLIKRRLRLRRMPAGGLGRISSTVRRDEGARGPAPGDQPGPGTGGPGGGGGTGPSDPPRTVDQPAQPSCGDGAPVPAATGSTDWVASTLPSGSPQSLRTWTDYVLGGPPGSGGGASVAGSDGATPIAGGEPYDHRLTVTGAGTSAGGVRTIQHRGQVRYSKPAHFIDNQIRNLRMVIAADGQTGCVVADGQYQAGGGIGTPGSGNVVYRQQHVLDLTRSSAKTWTAVVAPEGGEQEIPYVAGTPWGTFALPARLVGP